MPVELVQFIGEHGCERVDVGLLEDRLMVARDRPCDDGAGDVSIPSESGPADLRGERSLKDSHRREQLGRAVATHDPARTGLVPRIIETAWPAALPTLTVCQRNGFLGRAAREMKLSSCAPNQRLIPQHAVARGDLSMPAEPLGSRRVEEYEQLDARACPYQAACHLEGNESPE